MLRLLHLALIAVLLGATTVSATNYTATTTGDWTNPATWTPPGVPTNGDSVFIKYGVTVTVSDTEAADNLTVDGSVGATPPAFVSWTSLNINGVLNISGLYAFTNATPDRNIQTTNSGTGTFNCASNLLAGYPLPYTSGQVTSNQVWLVTTNLHWNITNAFICMLYTNKVGSTTYNANVRYDVQSGAVVTIGMVPGGLFVIGGTATSASGGLMPFHTGTGLDNSTGVVIFGGGSPWYSIKDINTWQNHWTVGGSIVWAGVGNGGAIRSCGYHHLVINLSSSTDTCKTLSAAAIRAHLTLARGVYTPSNAYLTNYADETIERGEGSFGAGSLLGWQGPVSLFYTNSVTSGLEIPAPGSGGFVSNVTVLNSGTTLTLASDITVNGTLTISTGAALADNGQTITCLAGVTNNGMHGGTGQILLAGGTAAHLLSGAGSYGNLELNDANGATITDGSPTVNGVLTLTAGVLATGADQINVAANGSVSRTDGYVSGRLQKAFNLGDQSFTFPIGAGTNYAPCAVTNLSVATAGNLLATTTTGEHPQIATSLISFSNDANRYWTLTNNGSGLALSNATSFSVICTPAAADLDSGAAVANFGMAEYAAGTWTAASSASASGNAVTGTGFVSFGDFAVGQLQVPSPVAGFTATPMSGVRPLAVSFQDTSTGSITNLLWSFGDGGTTNTGTHASLSHSYLGASNYTATLQASGPGGVSSTNSSIGVRLPPSPSVTSVNVAGGSLVLSGTNGVASTNYFYYVVSSTNISNALNTWQPLATNAFNADGSFSYTNTGSLTDPSRFYRVQMP